MEHILRNLLRIGIVSIYPAVLLLSFFLLKRKESWRAVMRAYGKRILLNTLIIGTVLGLGIFIFFRLEDTVYAYDYAWHWTRVLQLREMFFENPQGILPLIQQSLLRDDYTYLPALLTFSSSILNTGYGFFCLTNMAAYYLPFIMIMQLLYFRYCSGRKWLPVGGALVFYPVYYTIFFGEVDLGGMVFLAMVYVLILFEDFEKIDLVDNLSVNLYGFLMIFFRRWYLYSLVVFYLCYVIKFLFHYQFKPFTAKAGKDFARMILSGLVLLAVLLVFYRPYVMRILGNNYSEDFAYNDKEGKLAGFINYLSPVMTAVCLHGVWMLARLRKREPLVILLVTIIVPTALFWSIQSYEYHHYCIILPSLTILFGYGLYHFIRPDARWGRPLVYAVLLCQLALIFYPNRIRFPLFTALRKTPEKLDYKQEIADFAWWLRERGGEGMYFYLSSGSAVLNEDMIRNSILPDIHPPLLYQAVLDIRDGFPHNLGELSYVITIDPIQYINPDYQHMYDIITEAVWHEPLVQAVYTPVHERTIAGLKLTVYQLTGEYTPEIKQYFYDRMLEYYPDKGEYFAYILE